MLAARPIGRPPALTHISKARHVDEEDVRDTIRDLIDRLKRQGQLDEEITETMSMDWRAERSLLPELLHNIEARGSWVPRSAELVLFVREVDGEICRDESVKEYKVFNEQSQKFVGYPKWEAGVVGQVAEESLKLQDLTQEQKKDRSLAYSGFRVEPYPDPNGTDKHLTKRHVYVPLHRIRPLACWAEFMKGIPKEDWHPTIQNSLTVMSSMSIFGKYHFKGTWPSATISCRGLYIGAEMICGGDFVRLLPNNGDTVADVLHVNSIKIKLTNLDKASDDDNDDGHPYNTAVYLSGKAFTLDERRAWNGSVLSRQEILRLLPGLDGYGKWHYLHDPDKGLQVPYSRVLGRCFEAEPMLIWFPAAEDGIKPELGKGLQGVLQARRYSAEHDKRILPGKSWYWGDTRAESLDIETLNSASVSTYDGTRDEEQLFTWQIAMKTMEKAFALTGGRTQNGLKADGRVSRVTDRRTSVGLAMSSMVQASGFPIEQQQTETSSTVDAELEPSLAVSRGKKRERSEEVQNTETETETSGDELGRAGLLESFQTKRVAMSSGV